MSRIGQKIASGISAAARATAKAPGKFKKWVVSQVKGGGSPLNAARNNINAKDDDFMKFVSNYIKENIGNGDEASPPSSELINNMVSKLGEDYINAKFESMFVDGQFFFDDNDKDQLLAKPFTEKAKMILEEDLKQPAKNVSTHTGDGDQGSVDASYSVDIGLEQFEAQMAQLAMENEDKSNVSRAKNPNKTQSGSGDEVKTYTDMMLGLDASENNDKGRFGVLSEAAANIEHQDLSNLKAMELEANALEDEGFDVAAIQQAISNALGRDHNE